MYGDVRWQSQSGVFWRVYCSLPHALLTYYIGQFMDNGSNGYSYSAVHRYTLLRDVRHSRYLLNNACHSMACV